MISIRMRQLVRAVAIVLVSKLANLSHGSTDMNFACEANRPQGKTEKKIRNTKEQTQRISICIFAITVRVRERLLRRYSLCSCVDGILLGWYCIML